MRRARPRETEYVARMRDKRTAKRFGKKEKGGKKYPPPPPTRTGRSRARAIYGRRRNLKNGRDRFDGGMTKMTIKKGWSCLFAFPFEPKRAARPLLGRFAIGQGNRRWTI